MMRKQIQFVLAILAWFAVITQYFLLVESTEESLGEATVRFFSFFTILTNSLVAIYFTYQVLARHRNPAAALAKRGVFSAITVYIMVVGLVYQVALRHIWEPTGLQMIVDELLHTVIPLSVAVYWWFYADKNQLNWRQPFPWLIYPLLYLIFILVRGSSSGFYPYPFVHVPTIGLQQVFINSGVLLVLFLFFSFLLVGLGKLTSKGKAIDRRAA